MELHPGRDDGSACRSRARKLFHQTLVAKTRNHWRMPKELHRAKAGSPEGSTPLLRHAQTENHVFGYGGGAPKLFLYPCRQTRNFRQMLVELHRVAGSSPAPVCHFSRVAPLVRAVPKLFRPSCCRTRKALANAGWNYITNVEVVGSSPTPGSMPG